MLDLRNSDVVPRVKKQPFPLADLDPYQRLVVESTLAYYFRGKAIQYDSVELTQQSRWAGGVIRSTTQWPPEKPNEDDPMFSVCSAFCFDVISHAFSGYKLLGSPEKFVTVNICNLPETDPLVALRVDFGSAPGRNDYWHTPADTIDKVSAESLLASGRLVAELINLLDGGKGK